MTILPSTAFKPDTPGAFSGLTMAEYQSAPGLSKSKCDTLTRSPLDFSRMLDGTLKRTSIDALETGTTYHAGLFEKRADYYTQPETYGPDAKKWNGNATECKAWLAAHADKAIFTLREAAAITAGIAYIAAHPLAAQILGKTGAVAEVSLFAREETNGFVIKGRADWLWVDENGCVCVADLKTTTDATTRGFSRDILARRYHVQAAFYRYILRRLGCDDFKWFFIAFEKGPAPKCNVRQLAAQAMDEGERQLERDFALYWQCRIANHWPEFHDSEPAINFIDLPDFVYGDVSTLAGMTPATATLDA